MYKNIINTLPDYLALMRVDKPIGWLLLLWPTMSALWIAAQGQPQGEHIWVFVLGVFVMRSAGCVINDYADRNIDGKVQRTRMRPLAEGRLTTQQALGLFSLLLLLALLLLLQLPSRVWPWALPALAITIIYPYMKRFMVAPQMVLGLAFSFSIPIVFETYQRPFGLVFCLLILVNFLWVIIYDTVYAMSDREDDLKIGVKSTAIWFADKDRLIIALLQITVVSIWLVIMNKLELEASFMVAIVIVVGLFSYQQWLIKARQRDACFRAFLNNAWVGAVIWFGLLTALR